MFSQIDISYADNKDQTNGCTIGLLLICTCSVSVYVVKSEILATCFHSVYLFYTYKNVLGFTILSFSKP